MAETTVHSGGRDFLLVGTAHVSEQSVQDVRTAIQQWRPHRVCLELDAARHSSLTDTEAWRRLDIIKILKDRKGFLLLVNLVLSALQRRLGPGLRPGAEMLAAAEMCSDSDIPYDLCDRDIQVTMRRAWRRAGWWGRSKLMAVILSSAFSREQLSAEDVEKLKQQDIMSSMLQDMADFLPSVKEVLIDERDRYLATRIFAVTGARVMAVIGAGHVAGVTTWLQRFGTPGDPAVQSVEDLDRVPPASLVSRILPWVIPAAVMALVVSGFLRSGLDVSLAMLGRWTLINGSLAALGALAALAHPLTILVSFVSAPITSMNPTIGVGIVAGIVQAGLRPPRVADFEQLQDHLGSVRLILRNRITHALAVFVLSSIGSMIGTFLALPFLTALLRG